METGTIGNKEEMKALAQELAKDIKTQEDRVCKVFCVNAIWSFDCLYPGLRLDCSVS